MVSSRLYVAEVVQIAGAQVAEQVVCSCEHAMDRIDVKSWYVRNRQGHDLLPARRVLQNTIRSGIHQMRVEVASIDYKELVLQWAAFVVGVEDLHRR